MKGNSSPEFGRSRHLFVDSFLPEIHGRRFVFYSQEWVCQNKFLSRSSIIYILFLAVFIKFADILPCKLITTSYGFTICSYIIRYFDIYGTGWI